MAVGSSLRHSTVERDATPKPCTIQPPRACHEPKTAVRIGSRPGAGGQHEQGYVRTAYQGDIGHVVDDHARVLLDVFGHAADVGLEHVVAVQEGHLAVRLDPDLVQRVLRHVVERGHVEPELAGLGELADARAQAQQVVPRHIGGLEHDRLAG